MENLEQVAPSVSIAVTDNIAEITLTGEFDATNAYDFWNNHIRKEIMNTSIELWETHKSIDTVVINLEKMWKFHKRWLFLMISSIIWNKHKCIVKYPSEELLSDIQIAKFDTLWNDKFEVITKSSTDSDLLNVLDQQ
jgi:hypothetical protein